MKMKKKHTMTLWGLIERLSPILINPTKTSLTVSISKRFLLFKLLQIVKGKIEDDPHLNFISILKYYKILGNFLHGTIRELHRDRNKTFFKDFFADRALYEMVKQDLEWVYSANKEIKATISKWGVIIYDNYRPNAFNVLLTTIHSGNWVPPRIARKQIITEGERKREEDTDTHKIYAPLVLEKNGIWIDSKLSRFVCDYNRPADRAIYKNNQERWAKEIWKEEPTKEEKARIMKGYHEFYFTLDKLINAYRFNIIFDGHSMSDEGKRPDITLGTKHIPPFYLPVAHEMQKRLIKKGYSHVSLNTPYPGGNILKWMRNEFPDIFIFFIEVNKRLYMTKQRTRSIQSKLKKLSKDIGALFEFEVE
jgi:N-formylglutamate amidohydrolase